MFTNQKCLDSEGNQINLFDAVVGGEFGTTKGNVRVILNLAEGWRIIVQNHESKEFSVWEPRSLTVIKKSILEKMRKNERTTN